MALATNFAFFLSHNRTCYNIFAQVDPWTNDKPQKAAPPGAWLADSLHTCLIGFWLAGQENKQH